MSALVCKQSKDIYKTKESLTNVNKKCEKEEKKVKVVS